ncbi:Trk system potassium uptake protein TrkA [Minicystis rosea]|nr:Trk system potassium uptake protein TrkA [Minicystis rosea]
MTAHDAAPKAGWTRVVQAIVLVALFGLLHATTRAVPVFDSNAGTISAVGFLLLTGTLASELVEVIGLPHLSGYLLAGIIAGPHVLHLIDHHAVEEMTSVNALALALIALEGGAELKIEAIKKGLRSLSIATLVQSVLVLVVMTSVFAAARPFMPFLRTMPMLGVFAVALLWGTVAVSRSPAATLAILSQTRASGPVAQNTLSFVMTSDVVVAVLMAAMMMIARPMLEPTAAFSLREFETLGHELLGSVAIGTTLGLVLAAYVRLVGRQLALVFVALGFGFTAVLRYLRFDALLTFMVAGFVVQNLSKQGERFVKATAETGSIVYVVFFATAGAHLDIPLLRKLWPVALLLAATRAVVTFIAARIASRVAGDPPVVARWGWAGLVSQAGITLGLATAVDRAFPSFGAGFRSLAIATIAFNEMIGPVLFKLALDRSGETSQGARPSLGSLSPKS